MKRAILTLLVFVLIAGAFVAIRASARISTPTPQTGLDSITESELQEIVDYLASPELKGRRADTPESAEVAEYLSRALSNAGFEPIDEDYLQKFCLFEDVKNLTNYDYWVWEYFKANGWNVPECATNVAGILPGTTKADEYIVLVAHRDGIGVNPSGVEWDSVDAPNGHTLNLGADDNASGTAAVLEIVEALGALTSDGVMLERSVIVLFADAEEFGLWGSRYFVENPPVPLSAIVSVINLDMVGRNTREHLRVIGSPDLWDFAERNPDLANATFRAAELLGFDITYPRDAGAGKDVFMRSDHYSFYNASPADERIPVVFFSGGLHDDYHRPLDTADKIDNVKVRDIARLALLVLWQISEMDEKPDFKE